MAITHTISGFNVDLFNPKPEMISIRDIAHGLAMQCRCGGQVQTFYSVAQHNMHVMSLLPYEAKPYGLLLRSWAAYTGDMTPALVAILEKGGALKADHPAYKVVKGLDRAIHERFGLKYPVPPTIVGKLQAADDTATATEQRDLYLHDPIPLSRALPDRRTLKPKTWVAAFTDYLLAYSGCIQSSPAMSRAEHMFLNQRRGA